MRVLESTYDSVTDELGDEEREVLAALAAAGDPERETCAVDEYGNRTADVVLRVFTVPGAGERWAVTDEGAEHRSVWEGDGREAAEALYEETVRALAGCSGPGDGPWWTVSDVDGVAHAAATLTVEYLTGGQWREDRTDTVEIHLGRSFAGPGLLTGWLDLNALTQEAADGIAAHLASAQSSVNDRVALADAARWPMPGTPADALRVTLEGVTAQGPVRFTAKAPAPTTEPTADRIAAYRSAMQRAADEETERAAERDAADDDGSSSYYDR
ncbi:hypothetical protein AB0G74_30515 [Streptomyces sp. NPDC020875]|uniref:hypothetical protein n=1 Tax=Streptomyces sp. NPDC020875 TaxID=3154898 RepID=UPI0033D31430